MANPSFAHEKLAKISPDDKKHLRATLKPMAGKSRRSFLRLMAGIFLGGLGLLGTYSALHFLPRPPRKVLVKEKLEPDKIIIGPEYFLRLTPSGPLALSRTCPHLGCLVSYDPIKNEFVCPCHQSRFSLEGKYLAGPAKKDLARLKVIKSSGGLIIEIP